MNWVSQEFVPESRRPNHAFSRFWESSQVWLLAPDGTPVACVHSEGFRTLAVPGNPIVWGASLLMEDGEWMGFWESWNTDKASVIRWVESKLSDMPPRQLSLL